MELGLFTMPLHPPGSDFTQVLEDNLEQIVILDKLGYKEAWIGEHFTARWEPIPAPDLLIAQALPLTENIVLGTGVTCMPNHNPFTIAHRIAQLRPHGKGTLQLGSWLRWLPGRLRGVRVRPQDGRAAWNDTRCHRSRAAALGRPQAWNVRAQVLEVHRAGAARRYRPGLPHQALPEAPSPDRSRGRVRKVGDTGPGRRNGAGYP